MTQTSRVASKKIGRDTDYRAVCTCGYQGEWRRGLSVAKWDQASHYFEDHEEGDHEEGK